MGKRGKLGLAALALAVVAAVALNVALHAARKVDATLPAAASGEPRPGDIALGREGAPVSILAYVSLTCGHCARWEASELPAVLRDLVDAGKARLVLRDFPLDGQALRAATLVRCLPPERRLRAHHGLLAAHAEWPGRGDAAIAAAAGLSEGEAPGLLACADDPAGQKAVVAGAEEAARAYGLRGTPSFVVGTRVVSGGVTASTLRQMVGDAAP